MSDPGAGPLVTRYGPAAVVAGASEGIGAAFARQLAAAGFELVLVARRPGPLAELADELRAAHGGRIRVLPCDLAGETVADAVVEACRGLEIGLLVFNAAASSIGRFLETPLSSHLSSVHLNVRAPLLLAHALGGPMARRGRGGIILMSSLTAFQGTPFVASYGATKAFDLVLAEGLWSELRHDGVDVLACCAGATLTPGYSRALPARGASFFVPRPQEPAEVAREALEALGRRPFVVTGRGNRFASFVMRRLLTRRVAIATMDREMRRRFE